MRFRILLSLLAMVSALTACAPQRRVAKGDDVRLPSPPSFDKQTIRPAPSNLPAIVQGIPEKASKEQMDDAIKRFLPEFYRATSGEMQQVVAALTVLRNQPNVVASLIDHYNTLPTEDYGRRLRIFELVGELQRPDTMPFLHKTVWASLPEKQKLDEGLTQRDLEEMVRVKAVHGLAYLRTPETGKALIEIMQHHESLAIKIAAIDSYMWNNRDKQDVAQELYKVLPKELHKFVGRPRFHRGMDREQFSERLKAWQKQWASPPREQ